ncbi:MAG: hypothetical protein IAE77_19640 [Prosthecobacter sp.]|jgi:hypothetical protein|uniref:hypothetical protein n=1 Tax=Prosthecobacter sp. TaxID=1965333 RepID=UPI0019EA6E3B|nr:hypothetical protein [Prosthecobacter sp.]MBE2285685.1 hypothetical protein [Prosthecobacter sp.]
MKDKQQQFELGCDPAKPRTVKNALVVTARAGEVLSPAQVQFNKLMKQLENTRVKHQREQELLYELVVTCSKELMPLVDEIHRVNFQMVTLAVDAFKTMKLTARRREALVDLLCGKAHEVVTDSTGLTDEQVQQMSAVIKELEEPVTAEGMKARIDEEFDYMRSMMEGIAHRAGVRLASAISTSTVIPPSWSGKCRSALRPR